MEKTLYLECSSGISGDMAVAALLDLGGNQEKLEAALQSLPITGFRTEISRVKKAGIDCCDFNVILDHAHENHDHDMHYLYGHEHHHDGGDHEKEHHFEHHHEHSDGGHGHGGSQHAEEEHTHHHHHAHTGLAEIRGIIARGELTEAAKALAVRIFEILARAEAKAHDTDMEHVHFHEVGAVDSIVDIVAAAVLFDDLGIDRVIVPSISEGCGTVRCQHGILPVPVPAVLNIAQAEKLPLQILPDRRGELVTPTGAAFVAAVRTDSQLPKRFRIVKTGLGAGKRAYEVPSIVRAMLIEEDGGQSEAEIVKLEANVDDCAGEQLGFVMDRLFENGARDVSFVPCYMKKNRPAWLINVICMPQDVKTLEEILFEDTTTIGIRRIPLMRSVLNREIRTVQTKYGSARIKEVQLGDRKKFYPEYNDVAELARKNHLPYDEAVRVVMEQSKYL